MNRRLTKQRRQILEIVKAACYHPTAEQIFALAKKAVPGLSRGTVYRNLDTLCEIGEIRLLHIPGEPARYDADLKPKAYFVNRQTGSLYDLPLDPKALATLGSLHPQIGDVEGFSLILFGNTMLSPMELRLRKGQITKSPSPTL